MSKLHQNETIDILLICNVVDEILGVSNKLSEVYDSYKCVLYNDPDLKALIAKKPNIILLGFSKTSESIEFYSDCIAQQTINFPHFSILLCENRQTKAAFNNCIKGLFDDFIVFKPLYETYSLSFSVFRGLETELSSAREQFRSSLLEYQDVELDKCIDKAIHLRRRYVDKFVEEREKARKPKGQSREQNEANSEDSCKTIRAIESIEETVIPGLDDLINTLEGNRSHSPLSPGIHSDAQNESKKPVNLYPEVSAEIKKSDSIQAPVNLYPEPESDKVSFHHGIEPKNLYPETPEPSKVEVIQKPPQNLYPGKEEHESVPPEPVNMYPQSEKKTSSETAGEAQRLDEESVSVEDAIIREFEGFNILIAEDNATYRKILNRSLQRLGFTVHEAENGREALEMVQTMKFDIALLDLFMPELNGIETTRDIRAMIHGKNLKIIALSGNKDKNVAREWARSGLNDYLLKPVNAEKLYQKLKKHLNIK
ncbi:response regulator [Planctobacterium marinum]|uniref:response regulator n=1 Tax=Planctobacterium marinum TaxID=1631968 RepID=UPI001E4891A3|nr:response regulator [Planctobacterium marinum]MCC2607082.1 response regulator [Planctobacterium marinum]